ncbi:hypothetical protein GCM10023185_34000 [Hymenobacter saemangeumensis]|uniref:AlgX/AlgJ SGNH hydrolase-like domain-containing protein n=1 Tax=Hymenobacter saemangeumensis TaxID=1084522 RepID=A0ABP8IQ49_9BACT
MPTSPHPKAGLLALLLLIGFCVGWEVWLRGQGFRLSYNDDEALWAHHHEKVYQAGPANPVLLGSSRIKFGLDLSTWQAATEAAPTQLAMVGTSPRPVLADLARDARFKGTVLVDVTEPIFFTAPGGYSEQQAVKSVAYYPKWSIAQRCGFALNRQLETRLLLLDEELFSLRGFLERVPLPNRPKVFAVPAFPMKFTTNDFNRQTFITPEFEADTAMQNQQRAIWMHLFTKAPKSPMSDSLLTAIFRETAADVARIRSRGGQVVFVRMPSDGPLWAMEQKAFPRAAYWERLLRETGAPGIHFQDYPALARYHCPEWSHLTPADARSFTANLVRIAAPKTGWRQAAAYSAASPLVVSNLAIH